jgi:hypothetical protein
MAFGKKDNVAEKTATTAPDTKVAVKDTPQLPASYSLAEQIKQDLAAIKDQTEGVSVEKVRLSAKGFKAPDGSISETLQAIVLDFVSVNSHYEAAYDKDNPTPPDCTATGRNPNQLAPRADLETKISDACLGCPQNEFGSGPGNSKGCKNTRSLALMAEGADEDTPMWNMVIPPGSIRFFDTYVSGTLRGKHAVTPICVLTEFSMDTSKDFASPRCKIIRVLNNEELELYYSRKPEAEAMLLAAAG